MKTKIFTNPSIISDQILLDLEVLSSDMKRIIYLIELDNIDIPLSKELLLKVHNHLHSASRHLTILSISGNKHGNQKIDTPSSTSTD